MIRVIFVVVAVAIGATAVVAQGDPIAVRKGLMKKNAQHSKAVSGMVKGASPYEQATVDAAFAQWSETAAALPKAFPLPWSPPLKNKPKRRLPPISRCLPIACGRI